MVASKRGVASCILRIVLSIHEQKYGEQDVQGSLCGCYNA